VAYLVDQSGTLRGLDGSPDPSEVSGAASFELGPGLRALVLLSLPLEERPGEVAALVQDGGQAVGTAGSWQALVFRLEEQP
jgi:hypothetical protein